jgi:hypothetical protein
LPAGFRGREIEASHMTQAAERRVTVTVSAKGVKPKSYVVSAASQAEATTKATKRFIENHPGKSPDALTLQLDRA